jgi:hypothetical protein
LTSSLPLGDTVDALQLFNAIDKRVLEAELASRVQLFVVGDERMDRAAAEQWVREAAAEGYWHVRYVLVLESTDGVLLIDLAAHSDWRQKPKTISMLYNTR